MLLRHWFSLCKLLCAVGTAMVLGCGFSNPSEDSSPFRFVVVDVGQGLAQLGVVNECALAWDMGLPESYPRWEAAWREAGRPSLAAIIISHGDLDHYGGMSAIPEWMNFSGVVVVSVHEDTAFLRTRCGVWSSRITFRTISMGDTLAALDGVNIRCVWPPSVLDSSGSAGQWRNHRSLCFHVAYSGNSVFISSDIDSTAADRIGILYGFDLAADVLVVPHHGSRGSVSSLLFGYVRPLVAIISCAQPPNSYGHPAREMVDLLLQMSCSVWATYSHGTITGYSNGYYWEWKTARSDENRTVGWPPIN